MTATDLVTDPLLQSVLDCAAQAQRQALATLDLLATLHANEDPPVEDEQQKELCKQQKLLMTHLARLRRVNRKAVLGARHTKQNTAEARQEVDSLHLELQNLYYEQRHLRGEIVACESYEHTYEKIDMIPVGEFLEQHPGLANANEHEITEARIRYEHSQREALEKERIELVGRKEMLMKDLTARKEELSRLDSAMEKWIGEQETVRKLFEERENKPLDAT